MKRKFFVVMICALLCASGAWGEYYDEGNDGDSWETAYLIKSAEDLATMSTRLNRKLDPEGKYYKLTSDINSTYVIRRGWVEPITSLFSEHFDGQNHTINLHVTGLFETISSDNVQPAVRNLQLTGNIGSGLTVRGIYNRASICWELQSGIIKNYSFNGTVDAVGGIVTVNQGGAIRTCSVNASLPGGGGIGGIVGYGFGVIEDCSFNGTISGDVGGGIAWMFGGSITNCRVNANISARKYAGGIVGDTGDITISNCTSDAVIDSPIAGGIVGIAHKSQNYSTILTNNYYAGPYQEVGEWQIDNSNTSEDNSFVSNDEKPVITINNFPETIITGNTYTIELTINSSAPVEWSIINGALPVGMYIDRDQITGTPTEPGTYTFTLMAQNSSGSDTKTITLTVNPASSAIPITSSDTTPYANIIPITSSDLAPGVLEKIALQSSIDIEGIFFITSANILPPEEPAEWMKEQAKEQNLEFTAKLDGLRFDVSGDNASPSEPYNRNNTPLSEWRKENPTAEHRYLFEFNVPASLENKDVSDTRLYYHERNSGASSSELSAAFDPFSAWEVHELLGQKADKWYGKVLMLMAPLHGMSFSLWLLNPILGAIASFFSGGGCTVGIGTIFILVLGGFIIIRKSFRK